MIAFLFRRRIRLGISLLLIGLTAMVTACMSPQIASVSVAMNAVTFTLTATLPPSATRTPTPSPSPTATATATASATATPLPPTPTLTPGPTAIAPPGPVLPPQPDGVRRAATVPILMYHYISVAPSAQDRIRYGLSVPPEMFEAQLKLLHDNSFTTVTLRDVYEHLATGKELPEKPIVLTFDDGYVDNFANALPLLQKYGMTGTFFVLTAPPDAGNPNYLSWDMIQAMSDAGMDMQLHARDHYDMRNRSFDWLFFQIAGSRQSIEGHTGKPVIFMAYPSGKYDANVLRFLGQYHFWAAVTTVSGKTHTLADALVWTRLRVSGQMQLRGFARMLGIRLDANAVRLLSPTPTSTPTPAPKAPTTAPTVPVLTPTLPSSPLATPPVSPLTTPEP